MDASGTFCGNLELEASAHSSTSEKDPDEGKPRSA